jgi:hypothetical protein
MKLLEIAHSRTSDKGQHLEQFRDRLRPKALSAAAEAIRVQSRSCSGAAILTRRPSRQGARRTQSKGIGRMHNLVAIAEQSLL